MLTDVFATRYENTILWPAFTEKHRRFLVQASKMLVEQVFPFYSYDGQENDNSKKALQVIHDRVSMELGLEVLWQKYFLYGPNNASVGTNTIAQIIKNYLTVQFAENLDADSFIKRRLSVVELAFREREMQVAAANSKLPQEIEIADRPRPTAPGRMVLPGKRSDGLRAMNKALNDGWRANVEELNVRLTQAGLNLHYHNGFIQISDDPLVAREIEEPFWPLIQSSKWLNVDHDMKQAIDLRDNLGRDPVWYAARALESTIKIISDEKGWTRGNEKGASSYIDNLVSSANGNYITVWEGDILRAFFGKVRNPFGHGPGAAPMPTLTPSQTNWALETAMSWIKSLITKL